VKKSLDELQKLVDDCERKLKKTGRTVPVYRHKATNEQYMPSQVVINKRDLKPLVIYRPYGEQRTLVFFARPFNEFMEKFEEVE
jgi:hypothetical protein